MSDAPHRISMVRDILGGWGLSYPHERDGTETPYILATSAALATSPEVQAMIRKFERIADEIDEQVAVTRAYVADSGMDHNQRELMKICTSHFLDKARAIRAEAAALKGETT